MSPQEAEGSGLRSASGLRPPFWGVSWVNDRVLGFGVWEFRPHPNTFVISHSRLLGITHQTAAVWELLKTWTPFRL